MNAQEARATTESALSPDKVIAPMMAAVYLRIQAAANRGERSVTFPLYDYRGQYTPNQKRAVLDELRRQGYEVEHHIGDHSDPREVDYESVSW